MKDASVVTRIFRLYLLATLLISSTGMLFSQQQSNSAAPAPPPDPITARFVASLAGALPPAPQTLPLYNGEIPNAIPGPDQETSSDRLGMTAIQKVSHPTVTVYLPAKTKATRAAVVVLPGGGYTGLSWSLEGTSTAEFLIDHGIAAVVVKYRLPSDQTMQDKSIGPLQDAQQALRLVREHATEWEIDPNKVGVMGFSAGGHLAATLGTHFQKAYVANDDHVSLRPDFMILVYPVISMKPGLTHQPSREALLGKSPSPEQIASFSNEDQVTEQTPPTLLLHASDDLLVDVDNSVVFYEALHHHQVPAEMVLLPRGNHGFFEISREEWRTPLLNWLVRNGWAKM